tara:strand:+ start:63 stop:395 length:333 start_codon:yes stop_codon:yes gene_type:complete
MSTNVYDSKHVIDYGSGSVEYCGFYVSTSSTEYHAEFTKREKIDDLIFRIGKLKPNSKRCDIHHIAGLSYCIHHAKEEWEIEALRDMLENEVPDGNMREQIIQIAQEISE